MAVYVVCVCVTVHVCGSVAVWLWYNMEENESILFSVLVVVLWVLCCK